jgi:thiamine biosynthesis lipoprotein
VLRLRYWKIKFPPLFFILITFLFLLSNCYRFKEQPIVSGEEYLLDTVCYINIYSPVSEEIVLNAFKIIREIEQKMSRHIEYSEVSLINKNAGIEPVSVSDETFSIISRAIDFSHLSSGYFDITIGPLVTLWGIGTQHANVPENEQIQKTLSLVDFRKISLVEKNKSIFLKQGGMSIDLGAIAKGYAAEKVVEYLKSEGIERAIIDLGGNIYVLGNRSDGSGWNVGIQDPLKPRGSVVGVIKASDTAVVTSGVYERYFEKEGKLYHHILNTETGYPVDNGLLSVSVVTESTTEADALSTVFFISGIEKGMQLAEELQGVEAVFITEDKKVFLSSGLEDVFRLVKEDYQLVQKEAGMQ